MCQSGRVALTRSAALHFFFSKKKEIQVCQCASPEMTSAVGAGSLRKRTFRRFEFADSGTPAVGTDVPGCASVPRCAKVGRRVNGTGAGRRDLRIRTARALRVDGHTAEARGQPDGLCAELAHRLTLAHRGVCQGVPVCQDRGWWEAGRCGHRRPSQSTRNRIPRRFRY